MCVRPYSGHTAAIQRPQNTRGKPASKGLYFFVLAHKTHYDVTYPPGGGDQSPELGLAAISQLSYVWTVNLCVPVKERTIFQDHNPPLTGMRGCRETHPVLTHVPPWHNMTRMHVCNMESCTWSVCIVHSMCHGNVICGFIMSVSVVCKHLKLCVHDRH